MTHKQTVKCVQLSSRTTGILIVQQGAYVHTEFFIHLWLYSKVFHFRACLKCLYALTHLGNRYHRTTKHTLVSMTFKRWIFPWAVSTVRLTLLLRCWLDVYKIYDCKHLTINARLLLLDGNFLNFLPASLWRNVMRFFKWHQVKNISAEEIILCRLGFLKIIFLIYFS